MQYTFNEHLQLVLLCLCACTLRNGSIYPILEESVVFKQFNKSNMYRVVRLNH